MITGTAEAGSLVQIYDGDEVVGSEQLAPGQTSYSVAVPLDSNAPNAFVVTATDAAGNPSPTAVVPTITQDSIPPVSPTVVSPHRVGHGQHLDGDGYGHGRKPASLVQIYDGDEVIGSEQLSPGQTSYSVAVPLDSNSPNNFLITATDAAGNQSPAGRGADDHAGFDPAKQSHPHQPGRPHFGEQRVDHLDRHRRSRKPGHGLSATTTATA